jgi:tetratricopeptide (TPR) repeat protein
MKRLFPGFLVISGVVFALWLSLIWVPDGEPVHAWRESTGTLVVPASGFSVLPRWSYQRSPAKRLKTGLSVTSREGVEIDVKVGFMPKEGRYSLAPAAEPTAGLSGAARAVVQSACESLSIDCLLAAQPGDACPADLNRDLVLALASKFGALPNEVSVSAVPDPAGVQKFVVDQIGHTLPPSHRKVLVIGLDGLDWKLVEPWARSGRMPNLQRLMRDGSWGVMDTIEPMLSPLIWTSMATGFSPDIHGILDFVEIESTTGQYRPITGRSRRVPALWNIASAFSKTVSVVGWWATWPAERVNGVMVSDRLYYTLTHDIDPEVFREDPSHMVFPSSATARFAALRDRAVREADWRKIRAFMDVPERTFAQAVASNKGMADPVDGFRRILAATSTYFGSALAAAESGPDLLMVYIQATDEINHVLAPFVAPPVAEIGQREAAVYAAAVPPYFEHVDQWLGRLLESCPLSEYAVLLVSDHGTKWGSDRPRGLTMSDARTAVYWHSPDAVFVVAGQGVAQVGEVEQRYSVYDVAPSVMALLGLPGGVGWRGRLLPGISQSSIDPVDYRPLISAASYRPAAIGAAPADEEYIAKLRALGYLGGDAETLSSSGQTDSASSALQAEIGALPNPSRLNNLGLVLLEQERYEEAEECLRAAIDANKNYAAPHNNLRRLFMETGRWDEADRELWLAVDKGSTMAESRVIQAAAQYEKSGQLDRSDAVLSEATLRFPDHEVFWIRLLKLRMDRRRCREAAACGREAIERFPKNPRVHAYFGFAAVCTGDIETGRAAIARSLELDPQQPGLRQALARLPS